MSNETTYISEHESYQLFVYKEGSALPIDEDYWTARIQGILRDDQTYLDVKSSANTKERAIERVILDAFGVGERKDWM